MTPATAWRVCAIIGVPALAVSRMIGQSAGLETCGHPGGLEPVLAFEFVRNAGDVAQVLLGDSCRAGQATGLALDNFLFVPLYSLFVMAAAWAAGLRGGRILALITIVAIAVAAASDLIENATLSAMLSGGGDFERLYWAVRIKFGLIGLAEVLVGVMLLRHSMVIRFAGYMILAAGAAALVTLLLGVPAAMMKPIALGLILMFLAAVVIAIRPALAEPPQPA